MTFWPSGTNSAKGAETSYSNISAAVIQVNDVASNTFIGKPFWIWGATVEFPQVAEFKPYCLMMSSGVLYWELYHRISWFQGEGQWTGNDWGIIPEENRFQHISVLKFQAGSYDHMCSNCFFISACYFLPRDLSFSCCFKEEYNPWPQFVSLWAVYFAVLMWTQTIQPRMRCFMGHLRLA